MVSAERISGELTKLLRSPGPDGPVRGISVLVDTGVAEQVLPEVPKLRLERDEHFRHKDVYQHTLTVLARATTLEAAYGLENDLVVRLAALLHDIGKPKTRRKLPGPGGRVAFHHHEVVGAAMARERLTALRFPSAVVSDVSELVALHLRFHGYGEGEWTDSAVRRYVRDAGHLLTRLHVLTRADCTTRNMAKAQRLERVLRRSGEADRRAVGAGGTGQDQAGPERQRDHGDSWCATGADRRKGLPVPAGTAHGARPARPRARRSGTAGLGRGGGPGGARPTTGDRRGLTAEKPVPGRRRDVPGRDHPQDHR